MQYKNIYSSHVHSTYTNTGTCTVSAVLNVAQACACFFIQSTNYIPAARTLNEKVETETNL